MDANFSDMLIGLQWDTVIIGIQWMLMFVIANKPTVGYCYFWNTADANVCDMLIGLL